LTDVANRPESASRSYAAAFWRRRWVVVLCLVLVPAAAVGASLRQEKRYEASSQVLVKRQNLAATLTGATDPSIYQQDDHVVQTQADLARSTKVAERTVAAVPVAGMTPQSFLDSSDVVPRPNADFLDFKVTDADPKLAARLVNAYAAAYTAYRQDLDTRAIRDAQSEVRARLTQLRRQTPPRRGLEESLITREQQLATLEALQTSNAFVTSNANGAGQVQPRPVRNAAIGVALGLILGLAMALVLDRLDTRVRNEEELGDILGVPLLGRLAPPPRKLPAKQLVTLVQPLSHEAENFAMLRLAFEFATLDRQTDVVMVTSASAQEGKSTTVANLAVTMARAGQRVRLIDLDLRRPMVQSFFGLDHSPGLTAVVRGHMPLHEALVDIPLESGSDDAPTSGRLQVLPTGQLPPSPAEFLEKPSVGELFAHLREDADLVLVDAPPLLPVSDVLSISPHVDALLLVAHVGVIRRPVLQEFSRLVNSSPARPIGYIITNAEPAATYRYDAYYSVSASMNGHADSFAPAGRD
jgi:capsular exopolysaccharide synthesis family protein